ncbi:hypothetical protein, partial [Streptomyces sp. NPDC048845]|uniref:hypothetical protein n=1 Tax=Streptomyces sp. NPDC048845 TaxID=3155390 RepID=UPI00341A6F1C
MKRVGGSGQAEEGKKVRALSLVSVSQAAVAEEPSNRPIDLPAVPTEAFAGLDARPRDAREEPTLAQPAEVFGGEVRLVLAEFDGPASPWSPAGPDCGDAEDERLEGETVVHVRMWRLCLGALLLAPLLAAAAYWRWTEGAAEDVDEGAGG